MTDPTKWCPGCTTYLAHGAFAANASRPDGLQSHCRDCRKRIDRESYAKNKAKRIQTAKAYRQANVETNKAWVMQYLLSHPCLDCGHTDVRVLEFDHLGDKVAAVSTLVFEATLAKVKAEVAKCEVVCSNCHTIRTARRAGQWRYVAWEAMSAQAEPAIASL